MKKFSEVLIGIIVVIAIIGIGYLLIRRPKRMVTLSDPVDPIAAGDVPTPTERTYEIVELLPPDAIPAINNPEFYSAEEADAEYDPNEMVLGVSINGDTRAYSTTLLDRHEIVNDEVGGRKIAVTW